MTASDHLSGGQFRVQVHSDRSNPSWMNVKASAVTPEGKEIGSLRAFTHPEMEGRPTLGVERVDVASGQRRQGVARSMFEAVHEAHPDHLIYHHTFAGDHGIKTAQTLPPEWNRIQVGGRAQPTRGTSDAEHRRSLQTPQMVAENHNPDASFTGECPTCRSSLVHTQNAYDQLSDFSDPHYQAAKQQLQTHRQNHWVMTGKRPQ